jgi:3-deoxy-D-manno-octulosonic acid kinase
VAPGFAVPDGFDLHEANGCALLAESGLVQEMVDAGLDRPDGWNGRARRPVTGAGRGATARWTTTGGRVLVLKRLRRGGLVGRLWRDRHPGAGRLVRNLTVPAAARSRGVATPAAPAMLLAPGPPGLWRGWLAVDALDGEDLLSRLRRSPDDPEGDARRALRAVYRGHEAGLEHPDLNLGNLFVDVDGGAHVIDLDGARLRDRALGIGRRFRELLRLERSWLRNLRPYGPGGGDLASWILEAYAGDDREVADGLRARRALGTMALALRGLRRPGNSA